MSIGSLISTSVTDAKISLESEVARHPAQTARTAIDLLEELQDKEGQASRRKLAASILRKAAKKLEAGE